MLSIIIFLVVGLLAGWLAGVIFKGRGFGLIGNLIVGVLGSLVGGLVLKLVGFHYSGFIASTLAALGGALLLLFVINLVKK